MKLIRIITSCLLLLAILTISVAAVEFVPSYEIKDNIRFHITTLDDGTEIIGRIYDENGEFERYILVEELIITPIWHLADGEIEVHDEIEKTLVEARDELAANDWSTLITDFVEKWAVLTGGAPIENAIVTDIFDVRYSKIVDGFFTRLLTEGKSATFDIEVDGITADTTFFVIHKPSNTGVWKVEEHTINEENNVITISVDCLSPFGIVKDNENPPATGEDDPDSPQTGVNEINTFAMIMGVVAMAGCAIVCVKKIRKAGNR